MSSFYFFLTRMSSFFWSYYIPRVSEKIKPLFNTPGLKIMNSYL